MGWEEYLSDAANVAQLIDGVAVLAALWTGYVLGKRESSK